MPRLTEGTDYEILSGYEAPPCAPLRHLLDVWNTLRGDRTMPELKELDLIAHPEYIKTWAILDVSPDLEDFHVRFAGTGVAEFLQADPTGTSLRDFAFRTGQTEFATNSIAILAISARKRRPVHRLRRRTYVKDKTHIEIESLTVPFGSPEEGVKHVVNAFDYEIREIG